MQSPHGVLSAGGSRVQGRLMPLEMHQNQHLQADVGASARWADIAPRPLVFSSHLFPAFATTSCCRCLCVSEALPALWTWTGSSPRPGTAGGPEPDGALQNGCAGKDCTASPPQWWTDSENTPGESESQLGFKNTRAGTFHWTSLKFWVTNGSCQPQQDTWSSFISSASSVMALRRRAFYPSTKQM